MTVLLFTIKLSTANPIWEPLDNEYESWSELGVIIQNDFKNKALLTDDIKSELKEVIAFARTDSEKAGFIVDYILENFSFDQYKKYQPGDKLDFAFNIHNNKIGNFTDFAILAKALFETVGLTANPVFLSNDFEAIDNTVIQLKPFGNVKIWISGVDFEAVFDPEDFSITTGVSHIYSRTIWMPGIDPAPSVRMPGQFEAGQYNIQIDIYYDEANGKYFGNGLFVSSGCLCPYNEMAGLKNESKLFLQKLVGSILEGAMLTDYNLSRFDFFNITAGFEFGFDFEEKASDRPMVFTISYPYRGIIDQLPKPQNLINQDLKIQCLYNEQISIRFHELNIIYNSDLLKKQTPETENVPNPIGQMIKSSFSTPGLTEFNKTASVIQAEISAENQKYLKNITDFLTKKTVIKSDMHQ